MDSLVLMIDPPDYSQLRPLGMLSFFSFRFWKYCQFPPSTSVNGHYYFDIAMYFIFWPTPILMVEMPWDENIIILLRPFKRLTWLLNWTSRRASFFSLLRCTAALHRHLRASTLRHGRLTGRTPWSLPLSQLILSLSLSPSALANDIWRLRHRTTQLTSSPSLIFIYITPSLQTS